jgi:hypothetical protein
MNIDNTFDEVVFAATVGLEPDDQDLARIRVPAGEDEARFLADVRSTAKEIAVKHRAGATGEARQIAEQAQQEYLEKFAALLPIPAHTDETPIADIGSRMFGNGSDLTDTANRMFGRN